MDSWNIYDMYVLNSISFSHCFSSTLLVCMSVCLTKKTQSLWGDKNFQNKQRTPDVCAIYIPYRKESLIYALYMYRLEKKTFIKSNQIDLTDLSHFLWALLNKSCLKNPSLSLSVSLSLLISHSFYSDLRQEQLLTQYLHETST